MVHLTQKVDHIERKKGLIAAFFLTLCLIVLPSCGYAESKSHIECNCGNKKCTCFIQLNDEGNFVKEIIKLLQKQGYVSKKTPIGVYSSQIVAAVKKFQKDNYLKQTGMMDDDTLTILIWGMTPEQLDRKMPACNPNTVYIPTDGGKKRHSNPNCSNMENPRKVSVRNAEAIGFDPCKRCEPD